MEKKIDKINRLAIRQRNNIDVIREAVPKPRGYLPTRSLPTWRHMPVEQKIPRVPAPPGTFYYTRGELGRSLIRKGPLVYELNDPLNQERVPSNKHEDLHDPYPKIEENTEIVRRLYDLDLINEDGDALCSLKDFNRYRLYLGSLFNKKVHEKIALLDDYARFEMEQTRAFYLQDYKTNGAPKIYNDRLKKALEYVKSKRDIPRKKLEKKNLRTMKNLELMMQEREKKRVNLVKTNADLRALQQKRTAERLENERQWRRDVLHKVTLKDMTVSVYKEHVAKNRKITNDRKIADWFDKKLISSAQRLERENELTTEFAERIRTQSVARQKRVEQFRSDLPYRIAKAMAEKRRLENIVRKYAMRWLNRVRARLNKARDFSHESYWTPPNNHALYDCVNDLYVKSGHTKLDDLVLNVLNLKEAIKQQQQIEAEEDLENEE